MSTKLFPPLHHTNKFNKKKLSPPRVGESRKTLIFYAHSPSNEPHVIPRRRIF